MSKSTHHSFDITLASQYGIPGAILIHHFQHWINHNQRQNKNKKDGRTWTYQTRKEIAAWFPYFSEDQVKREINKLVESDVLVKENYNKCGYDKTNWYGFKDEEKFTMGEIAQAMGEIAQGVDEIAQPIPDTKTYTKPDTEKNNVSTMPPSSEKKTSEGPKNYLRSLSQDQRRIHDLIVKYQPNNGEAPKSNDVCAWFLAKKYSLEQVSQAFKIFKQDESLRVQGDMGAVIVSAIQKKRIPKSPNFEANKAFSVNFCRGKEGMEPKEQYVSVVVGNSTEQIMYSLPIGNFADTMENEYRKILNQI